MIPKEKIEQAILSELNNWDLSCSEEFALKCQLATALTNSILNTAGVRFAESELSQISCEFAEWCSINHKPVLKFGLVDGWSVLSTKIKRPTEYLFAKFMEEKNNS